MASENAYTVACIELFSRLWAELESASAADDSPCPAASTAATAVRIEMLRLELVLVMEACDSIRWRRQLDTDQRTSLGATLCGVLDALDEADDQVPRETIARSQNRLLDAMLEHYNVPSNDVSLALVRRTAS